MKKMNKKGFTLAELLIVVAIIAVLVAISIPVFRAQLERSREGVDLANIRAAYAECAASAIASGKGAAKEVTAKQEDDGWGIDASDVAGVDVGSDAIASKFAKNGTNKTLFVNVDANGSFTITTAAETGFSVLS